MTEYYRSYNTFFDILGNVGGLFDFLVLVFSFIIGPLSKKLQNLAIINKIFTVESNDKDEKL